MANPRSLPVHRSTHGLATIVDICGAKLGDWLYIETTNDYATLGKLRIIELDEQCRGVIILDDVRRVEQRPYKEAWSCLFKSGDGIAIPTAAIKLCQLAKLRYGKGWQP